MNKQSNNNEKENSIESKLNYYMFVYQKTDSFRQHILYRASLVIAVCAFLIGSVWNLVKYFAQSQSIRIYDLGLFFILILFLTLSMLSLFYSIYSIQPFYWSKNKEKEGLHKGVSVQPVVSAFPYIASISRNKFKTQCLEMDEHKLLKDALNGIYNLSIILNRRYLYLKKSYIYLLLAILFFAILILYHIMGKLCGIWR